MSPRKGDLNIQNTNVKHVKDYSHQQIHSINIKDKHVMEKSSVLLLKFNLNRPPLRHNRSLQKILDLLALSLSLIYQLNL